MTSQHFELKKIYYGLLAENPDYPAWKEFEFRNLNLNSFSVSYEWQKVTAPINKWDIDNIAYRHNPIVEQWQPPMGQWLINLLDNSVMQELTGQMIGISFVNAGLSRQTQEAAERDLPIIRKFCRLLAWVEEQGGYQFEFGKDNYLVYFDGVRWGFSVLYDGNKQVIATAYMSRLQAEKLCAALNSGEIEL